MSAGTIALTNNSANVTGTGTAFTTDLKAGDFIVVIVGGVTYTLGVKATTSATALTLITPYNGPTATGNAWTAVPNATLVGITAQVAADVAKAIRGLNLDKANWQQVFSGTGNITVTLPDGSTYTGPSWNYLANNTLSSQAAFFSGDANTITANGIYSPTATATNVPIAVTGVLEHYNRYGNSQMVQIFHSVGTSAATSNKHFIRTGSVTSGVATWTAWQPMFNGSDIIPVANGGTGATTAAAALSNLGAAPKVNPSFTGNGNISGTFTAGGQITAGPGGLNTSSNTNSTVQGTSVGWNSLGISGGSDMVCNRGTGEGGFRFRIVNQQNSAVIADFSMNNAGVGQSTGGWQAVCDIDVKDNVVEIDPETALEALTSWRTCTWQYMDTPSEYDENGKVTATVKGAMGVGFIAQDVQKDCPEAVTLVENPQLFVTKEGELFTKNNMLSLNTSGASAAYAGAAIKALKQRNEDQAELISALLGRLDTVETKLGIKSDSGS